MYLHVGMNMCVCMHMCARACVCGGCVIICPFLLCLLRASVCVTPFYADTSLGSLLLSLRALPTLHPPSFRHGGEDMIVTRAGVVQALISFVEENYRLPEGEKDDDWEEGHRRRRVVPKEHRDELTYVS